MDFSDLSVTVEKHEAAAADDQEPRVGVHQQEEEEGVRHLPGGRDQVSVRSKGNPFPSPAKRGSQGGTGTVPNFLPQ